MRARESREDYLEAILMLENRGGAVRSVDIAAELRVSKASVSVAMKNLRRDGFISMGDNHEIMLMPKGRKLAETMYERHLLFSEILIRLGVDRETALEDACRMEHVISADSFEALKNYFTLHSVGPPDSIDSITADD